MKVLLANLPAAVENILLNIKLGIYNANTLGTLSIDPDAEVEFEIEVVTADTFNTIDRTVTETPSGDEVVSDVTEAYNETTIRTPATVQTDDLNSTGGDTTTTDTTYTEFAT